MRRVPRNLPFSSSQFRLFTTNCCCYQSSHSPSPPEPPQYKPPFPSNETLKALAQAKSHANLTNHPQAPLSTRGFGPFTRNVETGKRLTFTEREEEKAKEYLYSVPDPNIPLPPLLLRPPGLSEPPEKGKGHGIETRSWWQREFEIWFGRYRKPLDVQAQITRHKTLNSYHTEWSPKADRRSVRRTHGKFFMSPPALFKAERSKYAPNFTGTTISSPSKYFESMTFASQRKATLIAVFSTQMAFRMCKNYLEPIESTFKSNPAFGIVRVQFEENWMKMAIIKYYLKSRYIRPLYTPEQQESYILTKKFLNRPEGEATHITNTQVGYILLVDERSKIRWMATGMPWPGELEALKKGIAKLVGEDVKEYEEVDYDPEGEHSAQPAM